MRYVHMRSGIVASHYIANAIEVVTVLIAMLLVVVRRPLWKLVALTIVYCLVKNAMAVGIQMMYGVANDGVTGMASAIGIGVVGMGSIIGYILYKVYTDKEC